MGRVIQFKKGEYICFRAKRGFHLGEMKTYLKKGEDVWFDGYSVDFGDGVKVFYPRLKSAIKAGWLGYTEETPAAETVMDSVEGSPFRMMVVDQEERVVGQILDPKQVAKESAAKWFEGREDEAPAPAGVQTLVTGGIVTSAAADDVADFFDGPARSPATPTKTASSSSPPAFMPVVQDIGSEGVVVGQIGKAGEVMEASPQSISAEELNEQRLIEALGEGSSAVAAAREARLAKTAGKADAAKLAASRRAQRVAALGGPAEPEVVAEPVAEAIAPEPEPEPDESQLMPIGPGITWDLGRHWATRVKDAVTNYAGFPGLLAGILKVESEGVRKAIEKALAKE